MRLSIISGIVEIEEDIADNTLRDLHNSLDDTRAELNIFLYNYSLKLIPSLKVSLLIPPSKFISDSACLGGKGSFNSLNILQTAGAARQVVFLLFLLCF